MSSERIPKVALGWIPAGKRKRGRPKTTWRKTVETELSEMGLSWGEGQSIAKDKTREKETLLQPQAPLGKILQYFISFHFHYFIIYTKKCALVCPPNS